MLAAVHHLLSAKWGSSRFSNFSRRAFEIVDMDGKRIDKVMAAPIADSVGEATTDAGVESKAPNADAGW